MRRSLITSISIVGLMVGLTACASAAGSPSDTANAPTIAVGDDTIVLDVRTADEYASGHLEGAQLLDFNGGDLADAIPSLDPEAQYVVYCRSGNRSGQAIALMAQAGFEHLTNAGSLDQAAAATGLSITR